MAPPQADGARAGRAAAAARLLAGRDDAAMDAADPDAGPGRREHGRFRLGRHLRRCLFGDIDDPSDRLDGPGLWRLRAGRPVRAADGAADRAYPGGAHAARSVPAADAADPGDGVAAA